MVRKIAAVSQTICLIFNEIQSMMGNRSSFLSMPPDVRKLHVAVMRNDAILVQQLVDSGIDVNYPWQSAESPSIKDGSTPLCEAVSLNHRFIVQVLLESGALVNKSDSFGCTPLHKSSYHGRAYLTELLIKAGADVCLRDHNDNTPLLSCVQNSIVHNNVDTVKILIKAGARVNESNRYGKIALHYAALWGLGEITELLIKAKSEIDHPDFHGKTPLYCSIQAMNVQYMNSLFPEHLPSVKVLIRSGCDTLNLASWLHENKVIGEKHLIDEEFYEWFRSSQPESLKQLCRQSIQKLLGTNKNNTDRIQSLPLPKILMEYLGRKLF